MTDMRIDCQVEVPIEQQGGDFADAFRITPLTGGDEYVLDFMSLSQCRTKASVVARIRVEGKFLTSIRDRLQSTLEKIQKPDYGFLPQKQVEKMWSEVDRLSVSENQDEGALPLMWFILPSEKEGG